MPRKNGTTREATKDTKGTKKGSEGAVRNRTAPSLPSIRGPMRLARLERARRHRQALDVLELLADLVVLLLGRDLAAEDHLRPRRLPHLGELLRDRRRQLGVVHLAVQRRALLVVVLADFRRDAVQHLEDDVAAVRHRE